MIRRGSARRYLAARRAWLEADPTRYAGLPGIHDDVTPEASAALEAVRAEMVRLKLLGCSDLQVQKDTIRRLVSELRDEHVETPF